MICFYKDNIGRINFGSYEVPPTLNEYTTLDSISNKTYGKLNSEQLTRYYSESAHNRLPSYVIEGTEPEPYVPTFEDLKNSKLSDLGANYATEIGKGFTYNLNSIDYLFNLDENTMENILRQKVDLEFQKEQNDYDPNTQYFAITDRSGSQRVFTITQFNEYGALFGRLLKGLQVLYAAKRNSINTALDQTALDLVDITFPQ